MFTPHYKFRKTPKVGDTVKSTKSITISHGTFHKGTHFILISDESTKCVLKDKESGYILKPDFYWNVNIFIDNFSLLSDPFDSEIIYNKIKLGEKVNDIISESYPNLIKSRCGGSGICKLKIEKPILSNCAPEMICVCYLSDETREEISTLKNQ